jgi:chromosome segregation ATPase
MMEEERMQDSLRELKDNNRDLRTDNAKLREQVDLLQEEMIRKNANLKRLKSEKEDPKANHPKPDQQPLELLRTEVRHLKDQLAKLKD